jgi:hypothetical protein
MIGAVCGFDSLVFGGISALLLFLWAVLFLTADADWVFLSLILSGLSFIASVVAIVLGIKALVLISKDKETHEGKGLAIGGIILGVICFMPLACFFLMILVLSISKP